MAKFELAAWVGLAGTYLLACSIGLAVLDDMVLSGLLGGIGGIFVGLAVSVMIPKK